MPKVPEKIFEKPISPGELYKGITVEREIFDGGERKLVRKPIPWFVGFCKNIYRLEQIQRIQHIFNLPGPFLLL